eukprot:TRINITY_DN70969_c0_g1_i2.p1 TRINITY_DN70969_c0_g1~~TRINITY_DN70969_c0_g1_i2.p1  ORF type:complete len:195 (-),score=40.35 TRINITY_DN70969_c0_g1_i2:72-656(-)
MCICSVPLEDALCGAEVVVDQLDGSRLLLKSAPDLVVSPGSVQRARGQGLPVFPGGGYHGDSSKVGALRGDLYVKFQVLFPSKLDKHGAERLSSAVLRSCGAESRTDKQDHGVLQGVWRTITRSISRSWTGQDGEQAAEEHHGSGRPRSEDDGNTEAEACSIVMEPVDMSGEEGRTWSQSGGAHRGKPAPRSRL